MKADRLTTKCPHIDLPRPPTLRSLRAFTGAIFFLSATLSVQGGPPSPSETVDIGSRLELFVDEYLIDNMNGVSLQLHRPQLSEPVLKFDADWEGPGNHYITVFKDEDIYRMYYRCVDGGDTPASGEGWLMNTCYAESKDGINWIRPKLGLYEYEGSKENNIILTGEEGDWGSPVSNFYAFRDANPDALASERYKGVGGINRGLYALVSADGVHWKPKAQKPMILRSITHNPMINGFDSHNIIFWDPLLKKYVAYIRDMYLAPGRSERIRSVRRSTSTDFLNWSYPEWIDMGDAPPDQLYTFSAIPYFRAPHLYLAFPKRFMPFRHSELPKVYDRLRGKGLSDSVFMVSRDGLHWKRYLEAFVRPGPDPLNWTDRNNYVARGLVAAGPTEIAVYVLRHFRLPSLHLRRGVLRTDGFVSVNAPYQGGEVLTKPLRFEGSRLIVNYSTSAAGGLRVEILDSEGAPLSGHSLANSVELYGDKIDQVVSWDKGPEVGKLAGQSIRLRFLIKDADLYSFRFK